MIRDTSPRGNAALGAVLALCCRIGLAISLIREGAAGAIGPRQAAHRGPWLRRASYLSSGLVSGVGIDLGVHGSLGLSA